MGDGGKSNEAGEDLAEISKKFYKESRPVRKELLNQMFEALTTGGVGARVPIISAAEEKSRRATSNTLRDLDERLAQFGMAGTPFGEQMRSDASREGYFTNSQIGPQMISALIGQIPGFLTGTNQVTVGGLGQAASAEASSQSAAAQMMGAILTGLMGTGGAAIFCDARLKRNIKLLGVLSGIPIYEFQYLWSSVRRIGPMAQDLLRIRPEAVFVSGNGYYGVNLSVL